MNRNKRKNLRDGLIFLTPNILGFLAFTTIPLFFSLVLAFSNWDLKLHNMFKPDEPLKFVGLEHFIRLLSERHFYKYLGNTLFFMLGIPFGIAGSLILALLLNKDMTGGSRRMLASLLAGAILFAGAMGLIVVGAGSTAMSMLLICLLGGILVLGVVGGSTVYRTLLYLPSFTAGVAVYILWKKLYSPQTGPINNLLAGPLDSLTGLIQNHPSIGAGMWLCVLLMLLLALLGICKLRRGFLDGETGARAIILPTAFMLLPLALSVLWTPHAAAGYVAAGLGALLLFWLALSVIKGSAFPCPVGIGSGNALMLGAIVMIGEFVLLGLSLVFYQLPVWAGQPGGLQPPEWLSNYYWAKPAIMIMSFWLAIGSNNMLLYLAGLSNVPQELYEAADIDGASYSQKFWSVTWPQLAPTTFFIVVMSVINGLRGGFEMARTMTQGGPAGATTTMSYFIYTEGFETCRLGYSSAVAWVLFLLVFSVTIFNWKFGNRYVND